MQVDLKRGGIILVLFLTGLILIWLGLTGRFGLVLAAIFTPEYVTFNNGTGGGNG